MRSLIALLAATWLTDAAAVELPAIASEIPAFEAVGPPLASTVGSGPASIMFRGINGSDEHTMSRRFLMLMYPNDGCRRRDLLKLDDRGMNPKRATVVDSELMPLPEGAPLWLHFEFSGSVLFGGLWVCASTVKFTPLPGHRYRAELSVSQDLRWCKARVVELDAEGAAHETSFEEPPRICGPEGSKNGQAVQVMHVY